MYNVYINIFYISLFIHTLHTLPSICLVVALKHGFLTHIFLHGIRESFFFVLFSIKSGNLFTSFDLSLLHRISPYFVKFVFSLPNHLHFTGSFKPHSSFVWFHQICSSFTRVAPSSAELSLIHSHHHFFIGFEASALSSRFYLQWHPNPPSLI